MAVFISNLSLYPSPLNFNKTTTKEMIKRYGIVDD